MNDGNGWEGDNGMRQVDSKYSLDNALELGNWRGLDDYIDSVIRDLEEYFGGSCRWACF